MEKEIETSTTNDLFKSCIVCDCKLLDEHPNVKPSYLLIAILSGMGIASVTAISRLSKSVVDLQERMTKQEVHATATDERLNEFSQALTDVRNSLKIQDDGLTKTIEQMGELTKTHLAVMHEMIKTIQDLQVSTGPGGSTSGTKIKRNPTATDPPAV